MNKAFMDRFFANEEEKPLDNIVEDGGYCRIFRTIGVVGDSLSSGEFESFNEAGERHYHDYYDYSWGQYLARNCGCKVYNFSRGGMNAKWYLDSFADENDFWNPDYACQAYIFALGVNDLNGKALELGNIEDIHLDDYSKNAETFAGLYGCIIQRLKEIQPHAKFFLMTLPNDVEIRRPGMRELLYQMAELFDSTYVLDLYEYGPVYDKAFREKFFLSSHMNPMGYILTAQMVTSYIDYIVRHNMDDFKKVGFIGSKYDNVEVHW